MKTLFLKIASLLALVSFVTLSWTGGGVGAAFRRSLVILVLFGILGLMLQMLFDKIVVPTWQKARASAEADENNAEASRDP